MTGYTRLQIGLHWLVMALVVAQYLLHEPIAQAFDLRMSGQTVSQTPLIALHVFGGFLIFVLSLVRLQLRQTYAPPPPPHGEPAVFRHVAIWSHRAFYACLVVLPVTGAVAWFRGIPAAGDAHEVLQGVLLALIALHLGGVAMHQLVWKTDILTRMTRAGMDR